MSRPLPEFIPLGFVHTDDYDGHREELINFIKGELSSGCLDNDLELWNYDWTLRINPRESGPLHRLALDWFGGKSRENGSHPDFPGIKYSCDVTAYPRPIEEEQEPWDRDPYEAEWENMCAGSSAYPDIPLYRPELVKGRLLSASDQSSCSERSRGPTPPWAVLIRRTVLDRVWHAVRNQPMPSVERPSMPFTIDDTANSSTDLQKAGAAVVDSAKSADATEEGSIVLATDERTIERLAQFIYARHPKNGGKPPSKKELLSEALQAESLGPFKRTTDFDAAYRMVFKTKRGKPPVTGWELREPYRSRLAEEKHKAEPELKTL